MANINEAFNTYKEQNNNNDYMNKLLNKIQKDDDGNKMSPKSINNNFTYISETRERIKVSDPKYDKIIRGDRLIYGYICRSCEGCMGYHLSIQYKYPHDFIKGEYRKLLAYEEGPFYDGMPLLN